jgi:hypothetical protein
MRRPYAPGDQEQYFRTSGALQLRSSRRKLLSIMRTQEEIQDLKNVWRNDPIWDIEDTEGFEDHYEELLAYRKRVQKKEAEQRHKELMIKSSKLGVEGNLQLAEYIDYMEWRIKQLEETVRELSCSVV